MIIERGCWQDSVDRSFDIPVDNWDAARALTRVVRATAVLAICILFHDALQAQSSWSEQRARGAFMAKIGGGVGFADATCGSCLPDGSKAAPVGKLSLAIYPNPRFGIGIEGMAWWWRRSEQVTQSGRIKLPSRHNTVFGNLSMIVMLHAFESGGPFVKLGAGLSWHVDELVEVALDGTPSSTGRASDLGPGFTVGVGLDFHVSRHLAVGSFIDFSYGQFDSTLVAFQDFNSVEYRILTAGMTIAVF